PRRGAPGHADQRTGRHRSRESHPATAAAHRRTARPRNRTRALFRGPGPKHRRGDPPGAPPGRGGDFGRFTDSTIAYQGGGRGLPVEQILAVDQAVTAGFRPHLTLVLDLPVAAGFARLKGTDRIEQEAERFHHRVRESFLRIAREEPERVVVIRGDQSPDEVFEAAWARDRRPIGKEGLTRCPDFDPRAVPAVGRRLPRAAGCRKASC
ncbi:Thymidylate kinase, partial [Geodia barretti]